MRNAEIGYVDISFSSASSFERFHNPELRNRQSLININNQKTLGPKFKSPIDTELKLKLLLIDTFKKVFFPNGAQLPTCPGGIVRVVLRRWGPGLIFGGTHAFSQTDTDVSSKLFSGAPLIF